MARNIKGPSRINDGKELGTKSRFPKKPDSTLNPTIIIGNILSDDPKLRSEALKKLGDNRDALNIIAKLTRYEDTRTEALLSLARLPHGFQNFFNTEREDPMTSRTFHSVLETLGKDIGAIESADLLAMIAICSKDVDIGRRALEKLSGLADPTLTEFPVKDFENCHIIGDTYPTDLLFQIAINAESENIALIALDKLMQLPLTDKAEHLKMRIDHLQTAICLRIGKDYPGLATSEAERTSKLEETMGIALGENGESLNARLEAVEGLKNDADSLVTVAKASDDQEVLRMVLIHLSGNTPALKELEGAATRESLHVLSEGLASLERIMKNQESTLSDALKLCFMDGR